MKTVTVKTSELNGNALDWAVAKAVCDDVRINIKGFDAVEASWCKGWHSWNPTDAWSQCGPLIDDYSIELTFNGSPENINYWCAYCYGHMRYETGSTPIIAICRAIVAAELGDSVDVPEELV